MIRPAPSRVRVAEEVDVAVAPKPPAVPSFAPPSISSWPQTEAAARRAVLAPPVAPPTKEAPWPTVEPPVVVPDTPPTPVAPVEPSDPSAAAAAAPAEAPVAPSKSATYVPIRSRTPPAGFSSVAAEERVRELYYDDSTGAARGEKKMTTIAARAAAAAAAKQAAAVAPKTRRKRATAKKRTGGDDSIRSYLQEIGQVKLLDADTEVALARDISRLLEIERISIEYKGEHGTEPTTAVWAAMAGVDVPAFRDTLRRGLRAKEHMVAANLRLVVSIAKKYLNRGLTFQDLIQEGSIGLIRGAEKFDADKGFKFSTYATWWIRQAITRAIADHSRPIRLPVHVNDTIAGIKKATKLLSIDLNRQPTEEEISEKMGISVEKLRFLGRSSRATLSLETPISRTSADSSATLGSFIVWNGDSPEENTVKSLMREDLENVLNTLSPRERDVVRMRYGFDDGRMKTLEEIGVLFAVTRERIRQIEAKALRKLRHPNRNAGLREYVYDEI